MDCHRETCIDLVAQEFQQQLDAPEPDIMRLSLLLGTLEQPLTHKEAVLQQWPENLKVCSRALCVHFFFMVGIALYSTFG